MNDIQIIARANHLKCDHHHNFLEQTGISIELSELVPVKQYRPIKAIEAKDNVDDNTE